MLNVTVNLVLLGCRYQNIKLTEFILLNSERVPYSSITFALLILIKQSVNLLLVVGVLILPLTLLRTILEPLISHVRLPFIDPEQLIECVKPTGVIDHSNILQAISYHISKKPVYPPHHVQVTLFYKFCLLFMN